MDGEIAFRREDGENAVMVFIGDIAENESGDFN